MQPQPVYNRDEKPAVDPLTTVQRLIDSRADLNSLVQSPELASLRDTRLVEEVACALGLGQGALGRGIALFSLLRASIALAVESGQEGAEYLVLRYIEDLPAREIAKTAHWAQRTVERRIRTAEYALATVIFGLVDEVDGSGLLAPRLQHLLQEGGKGCCRHQPSRVDDTR